MFIEAIKAEVASVRLLFQHKSMSWLVVLLYGALLGAGYLFVSTREATVTQLLVTLALVVAVPVLFFALVAVSVNYLSKTGGRKIFADCVRIVAVSVPLAIVTAIVVYALGKFDSQLTTVAATRYVVAMRYLVAGVIAPLLAIHIWIAASRDGMGSTLHGIRQIAVRALAPQSVFVYGVGLLVFAVAPYFLIFHTPQIERAWLEVSLLVARLFFSALLILFGWVTTITTLSLLSQAQQQ